LTATESIPIHDGDSNPICGGPANQTLAPGTHQNLSRNANNSATTPVRQNQARARVNLVAVEKAQAAPDIIIGMILINDNNAIMLFDFVASHSFVAASFV
jgi:hypothetical protein